MKKINLVIAFLAKYAAIGGQAVIEGVMMRSPNAFVVAVRRPEGGIVLRRDQWFGLAKKFPWANKPLLRGVLTLVESMMNGIVSLNYSANIAMNEELKQEALKKGKTLEQFENEKKAKEKIDWATFFTLLASFAFGIVIFVFIPHILAAVFFSSDLQSLKFHFFDGIIKACMFLVYIWGISFLPDIKRVFQYHGAEHKSIATFSNVSITGSATNEVVFLASMGDETDNCSVFTPDDTSGWSIEWTGAVNSRGNSVTEI